MHEELPTKETPPKKEAINLKEASALNIPERMLARVFGKTDIRNVKSAYRKANLAMTFVSFLAAAGPAEAGGKEFLKALVTSSEIQRGVDIWRENKDNKTQYFFESVKALLNFQRNMMKLGLEQNNRELESAVRVWQTHYDAQKDIIHLMLLEKADPKSHPLNDGFKDAVTKYDSAIKDAWSAYTKDRNEINDLVQRAINDTVIRRIPIDYASFVQDMGKAMDLLESKRETTINEARDEFNTVVSNLTDAYVDTLQQKYDELTDNARTSLEHRAETQKNLLEKRIADAQKAHDARTDINNAESARIDERYNGYDDQLNKMKVLDNGSSRTIGDIVKSLHSFAIDLGHASAEKSE